MTTAGQAFLMDRHILLLLFGEFLILFAERLKSSFLR